MDMTQLKNAIEEASRADLEDGARSYLGPSAMHPHCHRATWYTFRWAHVVKHGGRLLRLFNRGHLEEDRFARWLQLAGCEVQPITERLVQAADGSYRCLPWEESYTGTDVSCVEAHRQAAAARGVHTHQWGFEALGGHYRGHSDGRVRLPTDTAYGNLEKEVGMLECKTHNEKSFKALQSKGLLSSKPQHYQQVQSYMYHLRLPWCLYIAVNKNDDDIYLEIVQAKEEVGAYLADRAKSIIEADQAPDRYSTDPSWYVCKFCDYREICHRGKSPDKSCRSCVYATADTEAGGWYCKRWHQTIPKDFLSKGCDEWYPVQ